MPPTRTSLLAFVIRFKVVPPRPRGGCLRMFCIAGLFSATFLGRPVISSDGSLRTTSGSTASLSVADIMQTATLSGVAISPDRKFVAVRLERPSVDENTVSLEWLLLLVSDGSIQARIGGGLPDWRPSGDLIAEEPLWSSDSQWLYFKARSAEGVTLRRVNLSGHVENVLTAAADIDSFRLQRETNRIIYSVGPSRDQLANARGASLEKGVILDGTRDVLASLDGNMPYRGGMGTIHVPLNAWYPLGDQGDRSVFEYDPVSKRTRSLSASELREPIESSSDVGDAAIAVARSEETGDLAVISRSQPEVLDAFGRDRSSLILRLIKPSAQSSKECSDGKCRNLTGQVAWRPGTPEFIFSTSEESGRAGIYAWDSKSASVRVIFEDHAVIGTGNIRQRTTLCPLTESMAICVLEQPSSPPELVKIRLDTGARNTLFDPNEGLRTEVPVSVQFLSWPDVRGLVHTGVFVAPPKRSAEPPPPLVITSYVCRGFLRGGTGGTVPEYVLATHGIASMCINVDAAMDAPAYPNIPPGQATRLQYLLEGWEGAVRYLSTSKSIDPARVGVSGLSFTGEAVHHVLTHSQFATAATAGHMPVLDPINYYTAAARGRFGQAAVEFYGLPDPATEDGAHYYKVVSPALNAAKITAPLLVQTDEAEFRFGLQYLGALRLARRPAEIIVFPNEAHQFWQPRHQIVMAERNIDWFRFWLLHEEDISPKKQLQYERWKALAGVPSGNRE